MIAYMKKELIEKLKNESMTIFYLFLIAIVIFKIIFYKENFLIILRTVFAFFWLFILPGFYLMYYWHEKLGFLERFIIGIAVSASLIGIFSYYIGLAGLNIKYHGIFLPTLFLIIGFFMIWKKIVKH